MVRCGCTDVAIFRVHADGREERLPSYEEALGELERLRAVEALNVGAIDASLTRLGAVTGTIGPMPRHDPRCLIHDGREERLPSYEEALAGLQTVSDVLAVFGVPDDGTGLPQRLQLLHEGAHDDPIAALEAAERRLLEAGGYQPEPNESAWWRSRSGVLTARDEAVSIVRHEFQIERRRLAAKGGA
jgi:hypothetical protein